MPTEDHANLHTDMERILEAIIQAKLIYAVTPKLPEYKKVLLVIRPRGPVRGYSLWVKESYEAYRRNHV
ncbi:MAG: hypothetical protein NZ873_01370 [Crenarchaeota archaeon]|nr:hypothetical protein [Thermoproteota archaeon]MDW8033989.1 hypothetical protein [Nitrososphaerota archaeon]